MREFKHSQDQSLKHRDVQLRVDHNLCLSWWLHLYNEDISLTRLLRRRDKITYMRVPVKWEILLLSKWFIIYNNLILILSSFTLKSGIHGPQQSCLRDITVAIVIFCICSPNTGDQWLYVVNQGKHSFVKKLKFQINWELFKKIKIIFKKPSHFTEVWSSHTSCPPILGENLSLQVVIWSPYLCHDLIASTHTHTGLFILNNTYHSNLTDMYNLWRHHPWWPEAH